MRGLAIKKAQDDNFLVVCSKVDDVKNCIQTHRLAINDSLWYTRTREDEKLYGEAITSASSNIRALLSSRLMPNISKLMHLKVLSNAEWTPSVVYEPAKFGRLRQLRYVQLIVEEIRRNDIEKFQKFIGGMKFLQTLDLRNGSICDLPDCVWHVKTLRHVLLPTWPGFTSGPPPSINLINLQSLSGVTNRRSWVERGTPTLPNVKLLEIGPRDRFQWNTIATLLGTSNHLTTLQIIGDDVPLNIIDISKFPFHHHLKNLDLWNEYETYHNKIDLQVGMFPIQLITLRLKYLQFQQDPIPVLEQLENLRFLFLGGSKIQQLSCSAGGFNQLEELELRKLEILEEWKIEEGAMPKLKKLQVSHCPLLRVPHGLQNLGTLQELTWYSRSQFHKISKTMVNEIHKICKHVPSIITPEVC
ncbi:Disease resistance protein (CC-NBS-LRR class) family [Rhynchospora pubera]|uniref:Disease resistance protein (CC-NBS-LRR class) family n=1 Tax=Rhynchospora pubera TaxID=906938 RepID=A0AAV8HYI3_9POAL|nr:Disease resistance protein (CC-NBS-LRR class) family [Rhynchospora pubera]